MREVLVKSWEEFEQKIEALKAEWSRIRQRTPLRVSDLLFRGHSDAEWLLYTTLERYLGKSSFSMFNYYRTIHAAKHRVEAFTDKQWHIPSVKKYSEWLKDYDPFETGRFLAYDFMAYLRHHGYPSPLLDWTTSPFVAAFFAFRDLLSKSKFVAVFAYLEYIGKGKSSKSSESCIRTLGPYVHSHKRHFLQQNQYTLCVALDEPGPCYESHQVAFNRNHEDEDQDLLRKFIIPATERVKALRKLDSYNINAYSLLGSEESLMETIALRELVLRKRNP